MEVISNDNFKKDIVQYARELDKVFEFFDILIGEKLSKLYEQYINSLNSDCAIPYVIGEDYRYRSSPLATSLEFLSYANLLPDKAIRQFQKQLIWFRDNAYENISTNDFPKQKMSGDEHGWCCSEGVSVWSTSKALTALFVSNIDLTDNTNKKIIFESIHWLCKQQCQDGGWAFQNYRNCQQNINMTALALKALICFDSQLKTYHLEDPGINHIEYIEKGLSYALENMKEDKKNIYWNFQNNKNVTGSAWMLEIFFLLDQHQIPIKNIYIHKINQSKQKLLFFVMNEMSTSFKNSSPKITECIVSEAGAKYNKHKNFYSFLPALIQILLLYDVSPSHPSVLLAINYLIKNRNDWKIHEYDNKTCSFSFAMALSIITLWYHKCSIQVFYYLGNAFIKENRNNIDCIFVDHCIKIRQEITSRNLLVRICIFLILSSMTTLFISGNLHIFIHEFVITIIVNAIIGLVIFPNVIKKPIK